MAECERHVSGEISVERRYYLSSLSVDVTRFADAVRSHWGIENSVHWVLDLTFREDESRPRRGHAAENVSTLRRLALNLLKRETTHAGSQRKKRRRSGWDDAYREKVLFGHSL